MPSVATRPSRSLQKSMLRSRQAASLGPRRAFSGTTRAAMVDAKDITASKGEDAEALAGEVTALVDSGRWKLWNEGRGLERQFRFKTFKTTWDFMNVVAGHCKKQKHHPEWTNLFNKTHIRWTTHNPEGLSARDTLMARLCDEAAEEYGEVRDGEDVASCHGPGMTRS